MHNLEDLFGRLRRRPDIEAPNLFAADAADRLLLDIASEALSGAAVGTVAVIGDNYGALTLGAATAFDASGIRVHQDLLTSVLALEANSSDGELGDCYRQCDLDGGLLDGARVVLLRLPRSLAELSEIAYAIASFADPEVKVFAGGRDKHMTPAMNGVLARSFESVMPSLGRRKSRVVVAEGPKPSGPPPFPTTEQVADLGLTVVAHGAVFSGPRLDIGTRFLLDYVPRMKAGATSAIDLGCGTGILALALARKRPGISVIATDVSAAAVASACATVQANGMSDRIAVVRDDAMTSIPDASADLILCNPPFHLGAAVHTGSAIKMFRAAGRVLRRDGELWTVHNAHLNYRGVLEQLVGRTDVVGRNRKFIVTRSMQSKR